MKHTSIITRILGFILTAIMLAAALAGCSGKAEASYDDLSDELAYAMAKVSDHTHFRTLNSAVFSDKMFNRAYSAALMLAADTSDEALEKVARYLYLDSVTVVDDTRTVAAAYPADNVGKSLREIDGMIDFLDIVKNNSTKQTSQPVRTEDGRYSVLTGVKRADGTGAVIIGLTTDEYYAVSGDDLAQRCGGNTAVIKDGAVLSSTVAGVNAGDTAEKLGVTEAELSGDGFTLTVDSVSYKCRAGAEGGYTVICAEPA